MTDAKHTPGPWSVRTTRGKPVRYDGKWLVDGPTGLRSDVTGEKVGPPVADVHLSHEDARLIAAAPELLATLEDMAAWTDEGVTVEDLANWMRERAAAVIAKAIGAQ